MANDELQKKFSVALTSLAEMTSSISFIKRLLRTVLNDLDKSLSIIFGRTGVPDMLQRAVCKLAQSDHLACSSELHVGFY